MKSILPDADSQGVARACLDLLRTDRPLFSLLLDGKPSAAWLAQCEITRTRATGQDGGEILRTVYLFQEQGLEIAQEIRAFPESSAVEWLLHVRNTGRRDTPLIEQIRPLDIEAPIPVAGTHWTAPRPTVHYAQDYRARIDDFMQRSLDLEPGTNLRLTGGGGKTRTMPFGNVQVGDEGVILGLGWPGLWELAFDRPVNEKLHLWAGMPGVCLKLRPGETIRTPRVLLLPWRGTTQEAHNALRRVVGRHYTPQAHGGPVEFPLSFGSWGGMKTGNHLRNIELIREHRLAFDVYWMDAGWYGPDHETEEYQNFRTEDWFYHVGNWRVNSVVHPQGLKPISEAAHAAGMKYLLWFDPERASDRAPLTHEHPEWFFPGRLVRTTWPGGDVSILAFNFGHPEARRWMTDYISNLITEAGIDILRHDCNFRPPDYWQDADETDRKGMAGIRYAEGLLEFWDELRRRHPALLFDITQRAELESMSRGMDLTRSDYPIASTAEPIGNQVETFGQSHWRTLSGTCFQMRPGDTYHFRSGFSAGLATSLLVTAADYIPPITLPADYPWEWLRNMIAQFRRVRPYYAGDYYPLTEGTVSTRDWLAYQLDRPDLHEGAVLAFRRQDSAFVAARFRLQGLEPADEYVIEDVDMELICIAAGRSLMERGLEVTLESAPDSRLIFYRRSQVDG